MVLCILWKCSTSTQCIFYSPPPTCPLSPDIFLKRLCLSYFAEEMYLIVYLWKCVWICEFMFEHLDSSEEGLLFPTPGVAGGCGSQGPSSVLCERRMLSSPIGYLSSTTHFFSNVTHSVQLVLPARAWEWVSHALGTWAKLPKATSLKTHVHQLAQMIQIDSPGYPQTCSLSAPSECWGTSMSHHIQWWLEHLSVNLEGVRERN